MVHDMQRAQQARKWPKVASVLTWQKRGNEETRKRGNEERITRLQTQYVGASDRVIILQPKDMRSGSRTQEQQG